ncbi:AsnC family transcriptional regulator [Nocardia sp. 852002-20019_SCH5090214]|jgi:Lrp/AsnC family leucine-responsive transcriptional regulator|uniref:Leucine-responsive regulatory protein n=3 Tax=Nocardia TaxID=1817 RepID=A0A378WNM6_9NOCA|nr:MULTISPECIES: Lrp/AsnC family transcriptional regulator [Nocardia]OBF77972.1 AsnC family transcriptional regulator [Mycobacterium sp. 852002-51759_SCH5129042]MBF6145067.1 Lrp/AsnC family transcriptional regulator [Nocardia nova]MBF6242063.1 Lrp/AsnC family transcriptional regulator [Nocardia elegans]MBF6276250.1 Lrp/AsnC family transcriptional regulator [Nocardia nova]MBF6447106.1 Lrp/AsnC family transcriptional regulator [Nocardia elegans]
MADAPAKPVLDDIDRLLIRELMADGRATLSNLAEKASLSVSAVQSRVRRLEARGVIRGYSAKVDPEALGQLLSAFVAITPLDPSQPDDAPALLQHIPGIEECHSVAGEESYMLLVRVASPRHLEQLLQEIRATANVRTRSTIILQTFYDR